MRRTLALLALLSLVVCLGGCAAENTNTANSNSSNSATDTKAAPAPMPMQNTNKTANTAAPAPTVGGAPTGIKPPMKNEKK